MRAAMSEGCVLRGHEARRGITGAVRAYRLDQEAQDGLLLEAASLDDGEDPLDEAGASVAPVSERSLPPEDALSQESLSVVIRRKGYAVDSA